MQSNVQQSPPPQQVLAACDQIDRIIEAYLEALSHADLSRRFEAPMEVYSMLKVMLRFSESIISLARDDLVLLPAANVIARSLLEVGYRSMWLLQANDPFEREGRWLAYLRDGIKHYRALTKASSLSELQRQRFSQIADTHEKFANDMQVLLTAEGNKPPRFPSFREVASVTALPECYHLFVLLSAFTHSNVMSLQLYRRHLGTAKEFGEFIGAADWALSLSVAGGVFYRVAKAFLENHDVDTDRKFPVSLLTDFGDRLEEVSQAK
jgi:hypothetical protein